MENKSHGMSFISTLTLIFIVLKCFGLINISWIAVFCPIWIWVIIYALCLLAMKLDD